MANLRPFFTNLVFILINLGCFMIFPTSRHRNRSKPPQKPPSSSSFLRVSPTKLKRHKSISSTWSFITQIFSSKPSSLISQLPSSPRSSTHSISVSRTGPFFQPDFEIHPCQICGEVFNKHGLLEQHQSIKHVIYELSDDDPSKNIVRIIFETGWPGKSPTINQVMKIHNSPTILTRFEEYREIVKSKATARHGGTRRRDERCIADGNELLRFHCTTFLCDLGQNGNFNICTHQNCNVCGIIGSGFSPKLDGISTFSNSWKGHVVIPDDIEEEEFGFMNVKRAMLVCRVIAGRIGYDPGMGDKDDPGYDSLMAREHGVGQTKLLDHEYDEVIVFSPWAVLPCFVIVYNL